LNAQFHGKFGWRSVTGVHGRRSIWIAGHKM
jgi:hypothetical protein